MRKVTFYKMMNTGAVSASGYQETFYIYPDGDEISLVFEKRGNQDWSITEESTGLLVRGYFPSRKAAKEAITAEMLKMIVDRLPEFNHYKTMVNIARFKHEEV